MSTSQPIPFDFPSSADLCLNFPLYKATKIPRTDQAAGSLYQFIVKDHHIDTYCPWCDGETVLNGGASTDYPIQGGYQNAFHPARFSKVFRCSRVHDHRFVFYFSIASYEISKIGQTPAMVEIQKGALKSYSKVLGKAYFSELSRAVGLASHGVGIGSYVYLRRIFEKLVDEAHSEALADSGWDEAAYSNSRMSEKISLL